MKKNKLYLCFRPVVIQAADSHHDLKTNDWPSVNNLNPRYLLLVPKEQRKRRTSPEESIPPGSKIAGRKTSSETLSRVLKAILFSVSLRKRVTNKKVRQLTFTSENTGSLEDNTFLDSSNDDQLEPKLPANDDQTNSIVSSSSLPSSSSRSTQSKRKYSSQSKSKSFNRQKQSTENDDFMMYLIVFALFFAVFCGRVWAILFTSIWLYFLPPARKSLHRRTQNITESPETEGRGGFKRRK